MKRMLFLFILLLTTGIVLFAQKSIFMAPELYLDHMNPDKNYFYMLDDGVRIRSEPNLNGEVIGRLKLHDKIKVIENAGNPQKIDGVDAYWYLIEYEQIKGYIFGGYIAYETLIIDIDNNGIDDYFHFRYSGRTNNHRFIIYAWNDVIIYINNKKIPTTELFTRLENSVFRKDMWYYAKYTHTKSNTVVITLYVYDSYEDIFEIDKNGKITFLEHNEEYY